jgi:hypothetical protein
MLWSVMLPYWLVMDIENLLGWEHTLQISNQLIKQHCHYFDLNTTQIVITISPTLFEMLLCFGLIPQQL